MTNIMAAKSFKDLFVAEMQGLLALEEQVAEALPSVEAAISTEELIETIRSYFQSARQSLSRLKSMSFCAGDAKKSRPEAPAKAMLQACSASLKRYPESNIRDAAFLTTLQRLAGYRVAVYASTLALAQQMGEQAVVDFLKEAMAAEELTAKKFAQIAVQVNAEAFVDTHSERCVPSVS